MRDTAINQQPVESKNSTAHDEGMMSNAEVDEEEMRQARQTILAIKNKLFRVGRQTNEAEKKSS